MNVLLLIFLILNSILLLGGSMFYLWLIVIIVLTIIECMTVNLVTIWYVASALVSLILSLFIDSFLIQFGVFAILGTIFLLTTRKALNRLIKNKNEKTNLDRVIGMKGIVTEEIKKNDNGEVKVDGKRWTAYADKRIKVDSIVQILEINGVKLKVKEVEE